MRERSLGEVKCPVAVSKVGRSVWGFFGYDPDETEGLNDLGALPVGTGWNRSEPGWNRFPGEQLMTYRLEPVPMGCEAKAGLKVSFWRPGGRANNLHGNFARKISPASEAFTWYLLEQRSMLAGKRVLEIGAGLGLTGLSIAVWGDAACVHITDGDPVVVDVLQRSLQLNEGRFDNAQVEVRELLWDQCTRPLPSGVLPYDVIVGSEVIYIEDLHLPLITTMKRWLRPGGEIILCCLRRESSFDAFTKLLRAHFLSWTVSFNYDEKVSETFRGQKCFPVLIHIKTCMRDFKRRRRSSSGTAANVERSAPSWARRDSRSMVPVEMARHPPSPLGEAAEQAAPAAEEPTARAAPAADDSKLAPPAADEGEAARAAGQATPAVETPEADAPAAEEPKAEGVSEVVEVAATAAEAPTADEAAPVAEQSVLEADEPKAETAPPVGEWAKEPATGAEDDAAASEEPQLEASAPADAQSLAVFFEFDEPIAAEDEPFARAVQEFAAAAEELQLECAAQAAVQESQAESRPEAKELDATPADAARPAADEPKAEAMWPAWGPRTETTQAPEEPKAEAAAVAEEPTEEAAPTTEEPKAEAALASDELAVEAAPAPQRKFIRHHLAGVVGRATSRETTEEPKAEAAPACKEAVRAAEEPESQAAPDAEEPKDGFRRTRARLLALTVVLRALVTLLPPGVHSREIVENGSAL